MEPDEDEVTTAEPIETAVSDGNDDSGTGTGGGAAVSQADGE